MEPTLITISPSKDVTTGNNMEQHVTTRNKPNDHMQQGIRGLETNIKWEPGTCIGKRFPL